MHPVVTMQFYKSLRIFPWKGPRKIELRFNYLCCRNSAGLLWYAP